METPFHDFLSGYAETNPERCHTPGHKGLLNPLDITEIDGIEEPIKKSEKNAAELFGSAYSLYSCSGSTLAVFAMLASFAGRRVTALRRVHRSLIDAAILLGIDIDWVFDGENLSEKITARTAAVFITSIDYYGRFTPVPKVSVPVLADNAHGAYLAFTDLHPIKNGAAMSADSAHKTLPALTGAAYLHISNSPSDYAYYENAKAAMALLGTSSPSYLILDSLDLCNRHLAEEKKTARSAFDAVSELKKKLGESGFILTESDFLRVTIDTNAYGYKGADFSRELIKRGITPEMSDEQYAVLLFSTITESKNTERVYGALREIPRKTPIIIEKKPVIKPQTAMPPREAYFSPKKSVKLSEAAGLICAETRVVTPPGIPLIMPGEIIPRGIGGGEINVVKDCRLTSR